MLDSNRYAKIDTWFLLERLFNKYRQLLVIL